ncbi:MAG: SPOR domain-containing protein [Gemmatimonadota bacterium]|nr:SPOR domain-containing protein [Gemmatimonadota bacterium]
MRRLLALALAVVACKGERRASAGAAASSATRASDEIVLRMPRAGGTARAYIYPHLDSVAWAVQSTPPVSSVLAFDGDAGLIALVDDKGQPRRIDLRLTQTRIASQSKLTSLASVTGSEIFGVTTAGSVTRLTPSGDWTFKPPGSATWVLPQPDGSIVVGSNDGTRTNLWRVRPTDEEILDSASLPRVGQSVRTQLGDRLYFTVDSGLVGVQTRDLSLVKSVRFRQPVQAIAPTPSGDRLYVALRGEARLSVVDRYGDAISGAVELPGPVSELRMDPFGQQILARPASGGDSAWVIGVGNDRVSGTVGTAWRADLPAFGPGATIATVRGEDVIFVGSRDLCQIRLLSGGAKDFWYFFTWNGFRPRSADLDQPVIFGSRDTVTVDSLASMTPDSVTPPSPPLRDAAPTMIEPPASYPLPAPSSPPALPATGYVVSFAAVLTQQKATDLAAAITVNGAHPRVAPSQSGSTMIYRVVMGPFATKDEADRIGRDSGRQYWVYESNR